MHLRFATGCSNALPMIPQRTVKRFSLICNCTQHHDTKVFWTFDFAQRILNFDADHIASTTKFDCIKTEAGLFVTVISRSMTVCGKTSF
ncbi:hypothetical protein TNIN_367821 [Trichonephila inaurata madagascariensis]|uniref:Uncharacterized protein n=1 Tax=Trichonephila inaurata madagascariensis TaxID=2747483 RepID=A0A8X6X349_9ARAC|nr:hypothetical protein TNIN_367821 [Trichonephila inaurata madagascariensis]